MNFKKFHHDGKPILINLDNVTDIHPVGAEGKCFIFFIATSTRVEVDETLEQIQNLIEYSEK